MSHSPIPVVYFRSSVIGIWPATFVSAQTTSTKLGRWLVSCMNAEHSRSKCKADRKKLNDLRDFHNGYFFVCLNLLHSERPKLYGVLAVLDEVGLK